MQRGLQLHRAHTVPDSNYRTGHLLAERIDHVQQVPRVIETRSCACCHFLAVKKYDISSGSHTIIPLYCLVEDSACSLVGLISYPDAFDIDSMLCRSSQDIVPQRLVGFLLL